MRTRKRKRRTKALIEDAKRRVAVSVWFSGTTEVIRTTDPTDEELDQMMSLFAGWCADLLGSEAGAVAAVGWHVAAFLNSDEGDGLGGVRKRLLDWVQRRAVVEDPLEGSLTVAVPIGRAGECAGGQLMLAGSKENAA